MLKTRFLGSFRMKIASAAFLTTCAALCVLLSIFFVRQWNAERTQCI